MKWNDDWRTKLEKNYSNVHLRLCECRNTRNDIRIIAKLMYEYNPSRDAEDCLIRTLEWIGDWNSQCEVADISTKEYQNILNYMEGNDKIDETIELCKAMNTIVEHMKSGSARGEWFYFTGDVFYTYDDSMKLVKKKEKDIDIDLKRIITSHRSGINMLISEFRQIIKDYIEEGLE